MNIFDLREAVVGDYLKYVKGFINIQDKRIREIVEGAVDAGLLSPEPIVQLNPSYESGEPLDALVEEGILDPACAEIFVDKNGDPLRLYKHQTDAIRRAVKGEDYVLTTGTGSGKSLTYIIPIVNHILRQGSGKGVQAIIVYPMNALANSQIGELEKFLPEDGPFSDRIKFERYTGQESIEKKNDIRSNPPDVILTNYMMLELVLTRASEKPLVEKLANLRFFVLDELHSYRGRQGADVAMLARRTLDAAVGADADKVVCVGTSATIASGKSREDDRREVARVASQIFGKSFKPENVVGETLRRETDEFKFGEPEEKEALRREIDAFSQVDVDDEAAFLNFFDAATSLEALKKSRLASWIESEFSAKRVKSGELVRQTPTAIGGESGAAQTLAKGADADALQCAAALRFVFLRGANARNEEGRVFFPFKLHQFVGRGESAYATAELAENRKIYMSKQVYAPDSDRKAKLFPLVFCVNCGQDFYSVQRVEYKKEGAPRTSLRFDAREPFDSLALDQIEKENAGALFLLPDQNASRADVNKNVFDELPPEWKEDEKIKRDRKDDVPVFYRVNKLGEVVSDDEDGVNVLFVPAPFRFCPSCNVAYPPATSARTLRSDSSHLSNLSVGGRSSATTLLALATENQLLKFFPGDGKEDRKKRKFLSFTDNRQDASLQAGHFNDFVEVSVLRGALYKALQAAGDEGLNYDNVADKVVEELNVDVAELFAGDGKKLVGKMRADVLSTFKNVVRYQIMRDLRRGWRYLVPNLEQTGLLKIEYADVDLIADDDARWESSHPALQSVGAAKRREILETLLDHMRRELAIDAAELRYGAQERLVDEVKRRIDPKWGFDESDDVKTLYHAITAYPCSSKAPEAKGCDPKGDLFLTKGSGFANYLLWTLNHDLEKDEKVKRDDLEPIVKDLLDVCGDAGLINKLYEKREGRQLSPDCVLWKIGDGKSQPVDKIRQYGETKEENASAPVNDYFKAFYQSGAALKAREFHAKEHTAQVEPQERKDREDDFREGKLPILFCSPTMELGVDISELNVVHMRNIPPTPANYAQRSGRAGRSGQSALSLVYATPLSQHDRYYFRRPEKVVSGAVAPPQIDLMNEALLRSHVYAIWIAEAVKLNGFKLGEEMTDVILVPDLDEDIQAEYGDVPKEKRTCRIRDEVLEIFKDDNLQKTAAARAKRVLKPLLAVPNPDFKWQNENWIDDVLKDVERRFKEACERWMSLYNVAFQQYCKYSNDAISKKYTSTEKRDAERLRTQARNEIRLLCNDAKSYNEQNEFYPYRYFAAEGFLPGYNFPRLPVYAYLPGVKGKRGKNEEEYLSRPRFLAISEFGPKAIVYHEGARYCVESVSLAPSDEGTAESSNPTTDAYICPNCGYYHDGIDNVDVCENCKKELGAPTHNLLELQKVVAKRRTRITCDEEERLRFGYDVATSYRFAKHSGGEVDAINAEIVLPNGEIWGELVYGGSATIYRVNNGLKRQKKEDRKGFRIDLASGRWIAEKTDANYDENDDVEPLDQRAPLFVRPFVRDTKNCVVVKPKQELSAAAFASFQAALQRAIERVFSIDDRELGAFPLPNENARRELLLYEAAEGGAGALHRLLEKEKFQEIVREAFAVCHFDLDAGKPFEKGPNAPKEKCEAACYDCLLSYSNQRDHEIIDRQRALEVLQTLVGATLRVSSDFKSREELLEELKSKTESPLEREWLKFIDENNWRLPTEAQREFPNAHTRVDFFYNLKKGSQLAVYIDGPDHDKPQQKLDDEKRRKALEYEDGVDYLVFRYDEKEKWRQIVEERSDVFFLK